MGDPVYKAAADGKMPEFDRKIHQLGITGDEKENEAREVEAANQVTKSGPVKNPQNFSSDMRSRPGVADALENNPHV